MAFKIDSGIPFDPPKVGRPHDQRLAKLDDEAARAVIAGALPDSLEAAKQFASQYAGEAVYRDYDDEAKRNRIRDVRRRIDRRIKQLNSS